VVIVKHAFGLTAFAADCGSDWPSVLRWLEVVTD